MCAKRVACTFFPRWFVAHPDALCMWYALNYTQPVKQELRSQSRQQRDWNWKSSMMYNLSVSATRLIAYRNTHEPKRPNKAQWQAQTCFSVVTVKSDSLMKLRHLLLTRTFLDYGKRMTLSLLLRSKSYNGVMRLIQIYELSVVVSSNGKSMLHSVTAGLFQRRKIRG